MQKRFVTLFLLLVCSHAAAQDPLRQFSEGTHVRVRLKTGEELVGRILRKEPENVVFAAEAGNQVTIRELANSDIDSVIRASGLVRLSTVAEFTRRLPPGSLVRLQLVNGEKLEGKFLRSSPQDLELDLSRAGQITLRWVAYNEIRQIQMKSPRTGRPAFLATAPALIFLALRVARAF